MRGLKKSSDEQNDEKTLCVAFDGRPVAVKFMHEAKQQSNQHSRFESSCRLNIEIFASRAEY